MKIIVVCQMKAHSIVFFRVLFLHYNLMTRIWRWLL